jgi:hypothetical protein
MPSAPSDLYNKEEDQGTTTLTMLLSATTARLSTATGLGALCLLATATGCPAATGRGTTGERQPRPGHQGGDT